MTSCVILSRQYISKIYSSPLLLNHLFFSTYLPKATKSKMNEAFLRHNKGNETFDFTFRFINEQFKIDRQFNLSRRTCESVHNFLKRIDINIDKHLSKKRKKLLKKNPNLKLEEGVDNVELGNIMLLKENTKVDLNDSCISVLEDPSQLSMIILGKPYVIKYNAPWVISMKLPDSILAGFPVYPAEFEALYTNKHMSTFTWYKINNSEQKTWQHVGDEYLFIPTTAEIGSGLKLVCLPRNESNEGPEIEATSSSFVEAGPGVCPFETRHAFTSTRLCGNNFRILSYNILADTYADSDYSKQVLFHYCPPYALAIDYRKLLIIKELIGYNADIIALQEVDKKVYENDLKSSLSAFNYDGIYSAKGELSEGLGILYNNKRFRVIDTQSIEMRENIKSNSNFAKIWEKITNSHAKERFKNRNTSMLVVTLHSIDNPLQILVIGNTHLYFHPDADHIRLLQAYCALIYCQNIAEKIQERYPQHNVTIMLCGDFNSTPKDGVYELITNNYIPEEHGDWASNAEQAITKISLSHKLSMASACGTPQYTNFTVDFADCLDYIFYETNKLKVNQVVPMPSEEELKLHQAIPSVVFPSDHIAICADIEWS